jgi:hypothetical protein
MKPYAEAIEAWKVEPGVGNVGRPELMDLAMAYRCLSKALQGIPAEAILLLECTSGLIDQFRLAHWLGDKRRLPQLRGQCIAGISAHNDEWDPALL